MQQQGLHILYESCVYITSHDPAIHFCNCSKLGKVGVYLVSTCTVYIIVYAAYGIQLQMFLYFVRNVYSSLHLYIVRYSSHNLFLFIYNIRHEALARPNIGKQ